MYRRVLRGGPGDLSLRLLYITKPTGYVPLGLYMHYARLFVDYPPTPSFGGFGRAGVFSFGSIFYYYYYSKYDLIFNPNLSDWYLIRIPCLSVFSVGGHIRVWILLRFIVSQDAVLWPLVGTV
jgi:hypothetical protein